MGVPLQSGESLLMEASARFQGMEGMLALTDRRLMFYCLEKEMFKGLQYEVVFDVPLQYIKKAASRGQGLSTLVIETDNTKISGEGHHEFFIIDGPRWASQINTGLRTVKDAQKRQPQQGKGQGPVHSYGGLAPNRVPPPQGYTPGAQASERKKLSKICLNCMCVVPEEVRLCPRCGLYVQ